MEISVWMLAGALALFLMVLAGSIWFAGKRLKDLERRLPSGGRAGASGVADRPALGAKESNPEKREGGSASKPAETSPSEMRGRIRALRIREAKLEERAAELELGWERLEKEWSRIGSIDKKQARELVLNRTMEEVADEIRAYRQEHLSRTTGEIEREAKKTMLCVMQRMAAHPTPEHVASQVPIPNEEMKGRLIGREGRNIRSFESVTGTTLLIDDTPGMVLVSAFDPVRREVAAQALRSLIADGRIHPASIEEAVHMAEGEMEQVITELGEQALTRMRVGGVHPEVVSILGKLHYRSSNNQNTLEHSIEVGYFCSLMASELGLDPSLAKRAGLFHDIGKAIEHEVEGSHAAAGADLLRRHEEAAEVINAVEASHGEVAATSPYAAIVMLADSLSAARPGARADSTSGFIQRVRALERIAQTVDGVEDAYAVQAGREIRVIVRPEKISDDQAARIAREIRGQIEKELSYPGSIKITVVREARFSETAK